MEVIAKVVIIAFGLFFIGVGMLMALNPNKARFILFRAGSTNLINYAEITIRMIPAIAMIYYADSSKYPKVLETFGWFMLITSIVLYFVPRNMHHKFAVASAQFLKPFLFRVVSPFAVIIGVVIIYAVL